MSADTLEKKMTDTKMIIDNLDKTISGLRHEIERAQGIRDRYLGAYNNPDGKSDTVKDKEPYGHVEVINKKIETIGYLTVWLNRINSDLEGAI